MSPRKVKCAAGEAWVLIFVDQLDALASCSVSLHDESGQKDDIVRYIKSVVNTDPKMRKWRATDKELVINVLTHKVDGM